jgi:hypothetical protein
LGSIYGGGASHSSTWQLASRIGGRGRSGRYLGRRMEIAFYANRHMPHLILSGVFERFPGLQMVTTEPIARVHLVHLSEQGDSSGDSTTCHRPPRRCGRHDRVGRMHQPEDHWNLMLTWAAVRFIPTSPESSTALATGATEEGTHGAPR